MSDEPGMDETRATAILEENGILVEGALPGELGPSYGHYVYWDPKEGEAVLDAEFTADELEAIAWWMRNKRERK